MLHLKRWLDFLFPPRPDEIILRGSTRDAFLLLLDPQIIRVTVPETVALLPFNNNFVRSAIHEAKYHGSERAFEFLSAVLVKYLREKTLSARKITFIPLPLGTKRKKERGYNQVEEMLKRVAKELPIEIDPIFLTRARETVSQVSLPRHEREVNMRNAFKAVRLAETEITYVIIDDVVTTGATLQAAINALRDAGATHIIPLALAH